PGYEGHYGFDPNKIPIDFDLNSGWTAGGGVGFYSSLFNGSRFEIEGSYTSNDNGNLTYANFELPADFTIETIAVMFNFLKEVPLGETGATGYFGPGVGWHTTEFRGDIDTIKYSDRDSGFAWQLIAGVDFPLTERLALFTQYRFLVLDSELTHETDFGDFRQTTTSSPYSHAVMVGARVSF
ncbi:MAG: outer membrane beta-barrel protein, partial [Verrucomicrobiota bacterium]